MLKILLVVIMPFMLLAAHNENNALTLAEALKILNTENLEIKAAELTLKSAQKDAQSVSGQNWGQLNFIQDVARSNDAGNVFGFKLTSREATFGDFGFSEFSTPTTPAQGAALLATQPKDLNYPGDRNFFQSKLHYEVPLFTGFALSSYSNIMESVTQIKKLDKDAVINEKKFQLKKAYYDMALINTSIKNLEKIVQNIKRLEDTTQSMIDVGYAKRVDLLEVKAKNGNVNRLLVQMRANKKLLYHYISFLLNRKIKNITPPSNEIQIPNYSDKEILTQNIDIQKANQGLIIKKKMLDVSESAYYPTIGAFAEISTADDSFLGDAYDHKAYAVGARLTWNLFNGGIDSSKIEKSKIEELKMQSQLQLARKGIALKLLKIRTEINATNEEIKSLESELLLINTIYKNYEGRYKEKLSSMNDVIIKQSAQIEKILQLQIVKNRRIEKIFMLIKLANKGN